MGDDGGSSGRLRAERGGLPPGDLRQALAALADPDDPEAGWSAELLQFRFGGAEPLGGHAVGNLLLTGLMELTGDPVLALDRAGVDGPGGRPGAADVAATRCGIEARVRGERPDRPDEVTTVTGQHAIAVSRGVVEDVRLLPAAPVACTEAVDAVGSADWLVFGPGSWFTSVIPHLLVPALATAISASPARRLVTLNLATEPETAGSVPARSSAGAGPLPAGPASRCSSSRRESGRRSHRFAICGRIAACAGEVGRGRRSRRWAPARSGRARRCTVRGVLVRSPTVIHQIHAGWRAADARSSEDEVTRRWR